MSRKSSPATVRKAVDDTVYWAVYDAVLGALSGAVRVAVYWPVYLAVRGAVNRAASDAVLRSTQNQKPHPNLDRLLTEVRQTRGDAP